MIYKIAEEMNQDSYFPILGICLGFQLLLYMSSNKKIDRTHDVDNEDNSVPLEISNRGRLFKSLSPTVFQPPMRYNQQFRFKEEQLSESCWTILSTAKDRKGNPFIAAVEHKKMPFYGVQFHPEKSIELQEHLTQGLNDDSVKVSMHISKFFIDECEKSKPKMNVRECDEVLLFE